MLKWWKCFELISWLRLLYLSSSSSSHRNLPAASGNEARLNEAQAGALTQLVAHSLYFITRVDEPTGTWSRRNLSATKFPYETQAPPWTRTARLSPLLWLTSTCLWCTNLKWVAKRQKTQRTYCDMSFNLNFAHSGGVTSVSIVHHVNNLNSCWNLFTR